MLDEARRAVEDYVERCCKMRAMMFYDSIKQNRLFGCAAANKPFIKMFSDYVKEHGADADIRAFDLEF